VITLAVAQFKSPNPEAAPDPLVLHHGGPGASNFEAFFPVLASPLGDALLARRDVVIIESRGLYHSRPNLVCEEVFEAQLDMVGKDIKGPEANGILLDAMRRSQARFVEEGIDLPAYNHVEMAADIDLVLTKLGYDRFDLFGASAGTMVVQEVMRGYPERLRAVVMNAAVPNGPVLLEQMLVNAATTLQRYFAMCEADQACATAYPGIEARFFDMLAALNRSPVALEVTNPASREATTLVLNGDKVSSWLFASMYWNTQIIRSVDRFTKGDFAEIQRSPDIFFPMPRFAYALGYTAVIAANPDFTVADERIAARYRPFVDGLALFFSPRLIARTRELWRDDPAPSGQREPLVSDVPTLLMNGALDHVIPRESLNELASGLSHGHLFVFEGVAHSPADVGDCALNLLMAFLADPSGAPDASCMAAYRHTFALPE
jgi:pimeloyl-ACP methyl ester carboxylesterase